MKSLKKKRVLFIFVLAVFLMSGIPSFAEDANEINQNAADTYVGLEASYAYQEEDAPQRLTIALIATDGFASVPGFKTALQTFVWASEMKGIEVEIYSPTADNNDRKIYPAKDWEEYAIPTINIPEFESAAKTNKSSLNQIRSKTNQTLILLGKTELTEIDAKALKDLQKKWEIRPITLLSLLPAEVPPGEFVDVVAPFILPPVEKEASEEETSKSVPVTVLSCSAEKDCLDYLMTDLLYGTNNAIVLKTEAEQENLVLAIPYTQIEEPLLYIETDQMHGGITLTAPDGQEYLIFGTEEMEQMVNVPSEEASEKPIETPSEEATEGYFEETVEESVTETPTDASELTAQSSEPLVLRCRTIVCEAAESGEEPATIPVEKHAFLVELPSVSAEMVTSDWRISAPGASFISTRLYCMPTEKIESQMINIFEIEGFSTAEAFDEEKEATGERVIIPCTVACTEIEGEYYVEMPFAKNCDINFSLKQDSAILWHYLLLHDDAVVKAALASEDPSFEEQKLEYDSETKAFTIPQITKKGNYFVTFELVKGEDVLSTQIIHFAVENNPPTKRENIQTQLVCWELLDNHTQVIDLKNKFSDLDGDKLVFTFELGDEEPLTKVYNEETQQLSIALNDTPSERVTMVITINDGDDQITDDVSLEYYSLEGILEALKPEGKLENTSMLRNTEAKVCVSFTGQQENLEENVQQFIKENLNAEAIVYHSHDGIKVEQVGEAIPLVLNAETLQFNGKIQTPNETGKFIVCVKLKMDNDSLKWESEEFVLGEFECTNNAPRININTAILQQKYIVAPGTVISYDIANWSEMVHDDEGEKITYIIHVERLENKQWVELSVDDGGVVQNKNGSEARFTVEELPDTIVFSDFGEYRITFRAEDDLESLSAHALEGNVKILNLYLLIGISALILTLLIIAIFIVVYIKKPAFSRDDSVVLAISDQEGTEEHQIELCSFKKKTVHLAEFAPIIKDKPLTYSEWKRMKKITIVPQKSGFGIYSGKRRLDVAGTVSVSEAIALIKK